MAPSHPFRAAAARLIPRGREMPSQLIGCTVVGLEPSDKFLDERSEQYRHTFDPRSRHRAAEAP
jgi:hypothetical protein